MDLRRILNDDRGGRDDSPPPPSPPLAAPAHALRVGKWAEEEERYACALVQHFVAGELAIPTGSSLRSFLARKLGCSAMRVSTKLSMDALGEMKIPKKLGQKRFFPMEGITDAQRRRVASELSALRAAFLRAENLDAIPDEDAADAADQAATSSSAHASDEEIESGPMRVGNWADMEQVYAAELIDAFLRGLVDIDDGTTLRAFLSDRLCCNPMRISKKLATGRMASMVLPKRLGSATYRRTAAASATSATEYQLEQLRLKCFPTAPQHMRHHARPVAPAYDHRSAERPDSPSLTGSKRKLAGFAPLLHAAASSYSPERHLRLPAVASAAYYRR